MNVVYEQLAGIEPDESRAIWFENLLVPVTVSFEVIIAPPEV